MQVNLLKMCIRDRDDDLSSVEVFVHVSKDGFGAIGHVDICYQNEVIAYGAYDEASTHLFGAIGEGVLFIVDKEKYISFCHKDDMTSHIFAYTLTLNEVQKERIEDVYKRQSIMMVNVQLELMQVWL